MDCLTVVIRAEVCSDELMYRCPFLDQHPDLFVLAVLILLLAYVVYYGLFCLVLYLLVLNQRLARAANDRGTINKTLYMYDNRAIKDSLKVIINISLYY